MYIRVGDKEARNYRVIDLDTGKPIRGVQWANDETGEFEAVLLDKEGKVVTETDEKSKLKYAVRRRKKGNIKLVRKENAPPLLKGDNKSEVKNE